MTRKYIKVIEDIIDDNNVLLKDLKVEENKEKIPKLDKNKLTLNKK